VRLGEGVLERRGFTAGTIAARAGQLHALFADPAVAAIACARGGAGVVQLLPRLDRELLRANPKLLVGYSDITLLHLELARLGTPSLHGPMVARELADGDSAYDGASLWHGLTGEGAPYASLPDDLIALAPGAGEGVLRGGCLSLLAAACGTPWALAGGDEPTLLFLEDVDEKPYRVDRMLRQLRAAGALAGVAGVVFGDMKGCTPSFHDDYRLEDVLLEALEGLDVPVALGLSSGHTAHPNVTLPLGVRARLECRGEEARFEVLEAPVA
jgi:muramoyltetrapeptide carboxypeptidase